MKRHYYFAYYMEGNNHYNKKLKPLSRSLRNKSTKAEIRMWCELLQQRKLMGFAFLRQRAIDKYIADFFCKQLKLIIELDGASHASEEAVIKDGQKDKDLAALGFTVLRFRDEDVFHNLDKIEMILVDWIKTRSAS